MFRVLAGSLVAAGLLVGGAFGAVAHAAVVPAHGVAWHDARVCASFPEWGSSLRRAEASLFTWGNELPGTDRGLFADGVALRSYLVVHRHARSAHDLYLRVYEDCNPDA